MTLTKNSYFNREISWLQFNTRVLQEAEDADVPLINRLRFIGIFSNNLDEFFMVRYATIRRIAHSYKSGVNVLGMDAMKLLEEITEQVIKKQNESLKILSAIQKDMREEGIFFITEKEVSPEQEKYVKDYFINKVSPALVTIISDEQTSLSTFKDSVVYLAVKLTLNSFSTERSVRYALVEIPRTINRFVVLPKQGNRYYVMMLDDLIRYCIDYIFNIFDYKSIDTHMIKITRDAQLDIEEDLSKSFIEKISSGVKERTQSQAVRFIYDKDIGKDTLDYLLNKMGIDNTDSIIPGGRYHYRRDYIKFPNLGHDNLLYKKQSPLPIRGLSLNGSLLCKIGQKDYLQHTPYHPFSYVIRFLREAALDPAVTSIKITVYRLAEISQVVSSLINAAKNGKSVTALIELQARFDEEANIKHAELLESEGIKVIFGVQGLKVHSKICVIDRIEQGKRKRYGFVSTGNFNESTAIIYTDFTLFTAHQGILKDINRVFSFFHSNYKMYKYDHLIVSPHYTKNKLEKLIHNEIKNAKAGKSAYIKLKLNNLSNTKMIDKLYEASRAGVQIRLIVRGICCLTPGVEGMSENIEVISIVDRYLEHTRLYIFCNTDEPKVYISSADWMTRNIMHRVEVSCPIYDLDIKNELMDVFEIGWRDNIKARIISEKQDNAYRKNNLPLSRSQFEMYNYYLKKID